VADDTIKSLVEKAASYVKDAITLAETSNNLEIVGFANLTLSRILKLRKDLNGALEKVSNAKLVFEQLNDLRNLYLVELYKAEIHVELGETNIAIQRLISAEEMGNRSNHFFQHGFIYMHLGNIFNDIDADKSINYYEKALKHSSVLNKEEFSELINMLSQYYTKTKNIDKQDLLIKDLMEFYNNKEAEIKVELIESNQRAIEIQNKKISKQNIQLQNQNTELKNFASIASHDLKAPALSISSFASLVERQLPSESDPKILKYMRYIKDSSSNMSSLVNSLLEFSTIENRAIEITPINTTQLLDDVINNLYSIIELKKAEVRVTERIPKIIKGDETLLKIVFQNLINNALKFVKIDEVPKVFINYKQGDKDHIFEIIDNGIGIEKEYLEKIFIMFERLHSSSKYEGSGIGLGTCKKIMLLHNGNISIDSSLDNGSTFILTIPQNI